MDEVFGFFPPVANPPSKTPLLTLLKQARAFGLGCLLATQNPVDLDYKGLANCGTWWLGRLQTERDKARVLDGLEGALTSGGGRFDRAYFDRALSGLSSRVFVMNNVHEDAPVVIEIALGDVLPARPADPRPDQDVDGAAQGRPSRRRRRLASPRRRPGWRRPRLPRPAATPRIGRCCRRRLRSSSSRFPGRSPGRRASRTNR